MTFYVDDEGVMDMEQMFIIYIYNGVHVKYFPCMFDDINVLDVMNMLEPCS
jgi:hypothetical protein